MLTLKDAAAISTLALTSESLTHVANLSKLFCRLPVDHVRSKNGKADLYSDKRPSNHVRTSGPLCSRAFSGVSAIPLYAAAD